MPQTTEGPLSHGGYERVTLMLQTYFLLRQHGGHE
jgi:hypothetical protein